MKCAAISKPDSSNHCEDFILGITFCLIVGLIIIFFIDKVMRPQCSNVCKIGLSHYTERAEEETFRKLNTPDIDAFSTILSEENISKDVESGNVILSIKRPDKKTQQINLDPLCINCRLSFKTGDIVTYCSNEDCDHVFHQNCTKHWFLKNVCPACNGVFFKHDLEETLDDKKCAFFKNELVSIDEIHVNDSANTNEISSDVSEVFEYLPDVDISGSGDHQFQEEVADSSSFYENSPDPCASHVPQIEKRDSNELSIDYPASIPTNDVSISEKNEHSKENDNLTTFHSNIDNTLEHLIQTMKQTELSRLPVTLSEPRKLGNECNETAQRNSLSSPSLTLSYHEQKTQPKDLNGSKTDLDIVSHRSKAA